MASDSTAFDTALAAIQAAHASEVRALRERIEAAESFRAHVQAQLTEARSKADLAEALAQERQRVDELRGRLDRTRGEAQKAQEAAEALRRAEEARKARRRLRRVWEAWKGR